MGRLSRVNRIPRQTRAQLKRSGPAILRESPQAWSGRRADGHTAVPSVCVPRRRFSAPGRISRTEAGVLVWMGTGAAPRENSAPD
jgi:hypothetical protein